MIGVVVNQLHDKGIPWDVLRLSLPLRDAKIPFVSVSTDSSFYFHFDRTYQFLDIREKALFDIDHIPNAHSCPFAEIFRNGVNGLDTLKSMPIIIVDSFRYSKNAELTAKYLYKKGFADVMVMRGGFIEWLDRGYPVESGAE